MTFTTTQIEIEDRPLTVEYAYHPGCPQTCFDPGEPEEVEIDCVWAGDIEVGLLLDESVLERIQGIVLDKIKREADADSAEARYEQREADKELV